MDQKHPTKQAFFNRFIITALIFGLFLFGAVFYGVSRVDKATATEAIHYSMERMYLQCRSYERIRASDSHISDADLHRLMSGFMVEMGGTFLITHNGSVIGSNDASLDGALISDCPFATILDEMPNAETPQCFAYQGRGYFGARKSFDAFVLYVYYPQSQIFSTTAMTITIYLILYFAFLFSSLALRKRLNEKNRVTDRSLREVSAILDSLQSIYFSGFYVDVKNDRFRTLFVPEWLKPLCPAEGVYSSLVETSIPQATTEEYASLLVEQLSPARIREALRAETLSTMRHSYSVDYLAQRGDAQVWCRATVVVVDLDVDGCPMHVLGMLQEISEQKEQERIYQEKILQSAKQARTANAAKTRFLSSMSHDIRTPLNAILGMVQIARKHADDPAHVDDCLTKIELAGQHLLTLVSDVLDITQIESGNLSITPIEFDISETAHILVSILYPLIRQKRQTCQIHLDNITQEWLYADRSRLNQIWINLISNAIKYTPEGGHIDLYLSEQEIEGDPEHIALSFRVKDTGIGMTQEFQKRIFETFARATDSRIDTVEGSGLGMSIVKQLVDLLGGTISIESEVGKGSCFCVTLPLQKAVQHAHSDALAGRTVLLVGADMQCTRKFLTDMGAKADISTTDPVAMLYSVGYDTVIIDRNMDDTACLATATALRAASDDVTILISAYDASDIDSAARKCGVDGFLPRPLFRPALRKGLGCRRRSASGGALASEADLHGLHMLVAEDNDINWEIVHEFLRAHGILADRAENGTQCLDMLTEAPPSYYSLILMDVQMPKLNGIEAAKRIRALPNPTRAQIPILAMTANAFAEDIWACRDAGMNAHIAKPIDWNTLLIRIHSLISGTHPSIGRNGK